MAAQPVPLRRQPVQERSAQRVQRMLDAAAQLLDEVGYDATTTSLVAQRAGVSVGSLYQFFPDKHSVAKALARRSFERFTQRLEARLAQARPRRWPEAVPVVVGVYAEFCRSEPGFRVLSFGGPVDMHVLDPDDDNNGVVARRLGEVLQRLEPGLVMTPEVARAVRVAVEAGDAVIGLAFRVDGDGDLLLLREAERVVTAYLQAALAARPAR